MIMTKKELGLRIPGPTPLPPEVTLPMSRPMINHRGAEFRNLWREALAGLQEVFQTDNECIILAGSGTAAMEAAVANLVEPGTPVLVVVGGKFGQRWADLTKAYKAATFELQVPWGEGVSTEALREAIAAHRPEVVFLTHNESSTGVRNDIASLCAVCREAGCLTVVDAVSSLGGAEFYTDRWGVDITVTGSQKCLMLPPGLSFLAVSAAAWQRIKKINSPRYYFDLERYRQANKIGEAPFTPAVSLVFGLVESLRLIRSEGLERSWQRHALLQQMTRRGLEALHLELLVEEKWASPTVTAVKSPPGIDVEKWRKEVASRTGVVLSGGQDHLKGRIFRVGHMGYIVPLEILATLKAIETTLRAFGYEAAGPGSGSAASASASASAAVRTAEEVWLNWPSMF